VQNPYTWTNLTNVVWVEQPVGTGFSQGTPTAKDEKDVAAQFLGFWKNFLELFEMENRKIYITGESYAGYYVPYIADAMLNMKDKKHFDLEATMIYDPSTTFNVIAEQVPAVQFVDYHRNLFPFNDSFTEYIHNKSDACGYTDYIEKYLKFPPPGPFPTKLPGTDSNGVTLPSCDVFDDISSAASLLNPCFDIYQVATTCPVLWDVLGFPGSFDYLPDGASIYFNRTDVKKAINAPDINWMECTNINVFVGQGDLSPPSGTPGGPLASVIERSKRTIISHAALDMVLIANGTMLMIQNMTWGGKQGFQTKPIEPFYVPYHDNLNPSTFAGSGVFGTTHTERGLTWIGVDLSGHMVPQYTPSAAYRMVEFLLGRIDSVSSTNPFTTDPFPQPSGPLGDGTAPPY
jgi:carboxypeptidase D